MSSVAPSAPYSLTVRLAIKNRPGMLGRVGLLDSRARTVNDEMKLAAAHAIAGCVSRSELGPEDIIPSIFNKSVAPAVAAGVARAAHETRAARRRRRPDARASR
ncbi:MAG: malic enzyme-like NAD(P)-binding protein [Candidatus Rokuibacteriota bacterium]